MDTVHITSAPEGDLLSITFGHPPTATGDQLSDQVRLRVGPKAQTAAGLAIFHYSIHASTMRTLPLPGIDEARVVKPALLRILATSPINHFLRLTKSKAGGSVTLRRPSVQEAVAA